MIRLYLLEKGSFYSSSQIRTRVIYGVCVRPVCPPSAKRRFLTELFDLLTQEMVASVNNGSLHRYVESPARYLICFCLPVVFIKCSNSLDFVNVCKKYDTVPYVTVRYDIVLFSP